MRRIVLCYRKIIDASATGRWEQQLFEDTYCEYRMQAQTLDPQQQWRSFGELLRQQPRAEQLHFLVSVAIGGYLQQLNGLVPDISDSLGRRFLKFNQYRFEIINSDLADKSRHQVAINFFAEPLVWHDTIGELLLVSDPAAALDTNGAVPTHLFRLLPFLSIHSLQAAA